jgi:hypothetical protein
MDVFGTQTMHSLRFLDVVVLGAPSLLLYRFVVLVILSQQVFQSFTLPAPSGLVSLHLNQQRSGSHRFSYFRLDTQLSLQVFNLMTKFLN